LQLADPSVYAESERVRSIAARTQEIERLLLERYSAWERASRELEAVERELVGEGG
jgi:hypothetical protein